MASSDQNKLMASRLKAEGVQRTSARCPVCGKVVGGNMKEGSVDIYGHIAFKCLKQNG